MVVNYSSYKDAGTKKEAPPKETGQLKEVINALEELQRDAAVPKNVKTRIANTITCLRSAEELSIKINKALSELDELGEDSNIEPFTRTQIWNIVSLLEKF